MLKILFTGNIGKAAEIRTLNSGDMAISFNVAHTQKTGDGQEITTWVSCTKWVKAGASTKIADFLKKGQRVLIEGTPSARAWLQADNSARAELDCRVLNIELLGAPTERTNAPAAPAAATTTENAAPVEDNLPF